MNKDNKEYGFISDTKAVVVFFVAALVLTGLNAELGVSTDLFYDSLLTNEMVSGLLFSITVLVFFFGFLPRMCFKEIDNNLKNFDPVQLNGFLVKFEKLKGKMVEVQGQESELAKKLSQQALVQHLILDDEIIQKESSRELTKRVWVLSRDLKYDSSEKNIKRIQKSLKVGIEYIWVVPSSVSNPELDRFKSNLNSGLDDESIKNYDIKIVPEKKWMLTNDLTIYNYPHPEEGAKINEKYQIFETMTESGNFLEISIKTIGPLLESVKNIVKG